MKLKFWVLSGLALAISTLSGCGYHIGRVSHPQLKTVAVGTVTNETVAYNVSAQTKAALCEQFMVDGSMKLVGEDEADCVLFVRVTGISFSETSSISFDNRDKVFLPQEWSALITMDYSLIVPGRKSPILQGNASGTSIFHSNADLLGNQQSGVQAAARDAAVNIVRKITEGW